MQDNILLWTFLDDYQKKGFLATPNLIFVFFEELMKSKDLVLARGDLTDGFLTKEEANELFTNMVSFYQNPELFNEYVLPFNRNSSEFDMKKYCKLMDIQYATK